MLPAIRGGKGRGRRRNENSVDVRAPGRQPVLQNPAEHSRPREISAAGLERDDAVHMQFCAVGNNAENSASEPAINQEKSSKAQENKQVLNPEELGIHIKRKLIIEPALPVRPDEGNLGKRIKLISNCYPVKFPSGYLYHYDVKVMRKRTNVESGLGTALLPAGADKSDKKYQCLMTKKNREIIELMLNTNALFNNSYAAYDGQKNLLTRNPLEAHFPIKCEVILPNENANPEDPHPRQDAFEVEIKPVIKKETGSCTINLDSICAFFEKRTSSVPQEAVMALETILRHGPCLRFTPVGRSFFYPPNAGDLHPLGGGLEIWFGHHQSVHLGQWGPMVNLNVTATAFHEKGPVLSRIAEILNTTVGALRRMPYLSNVDIKRISKKLKNMRIEVTHLRNYRRKYRILKLIKENANHLEFKLTENGTTVNKTVAAYFRERYDKILEFPNLPCLQVYPENKSTYLPIEVCEFIEGQHSKKKLEGKELANMIKYTALPPIDRFAKIKEVVHKLNFNNDRSVRGFGLEVSPEPVHLQGRVLDPPTICYKNHKIVETCNGSWNMRGNQFFNGTIIKSWVLLSLTQMKPADSLKKFANLLVKVANEMGISMNTPVYSNTIDILRCDLNSLFSSMKQKYKAQLAIIIIPEDDKFIYARIKQEAETVVGLVTQCIKKSNVIKSSPPLIANLCQKINCKMGGSNNCLLPSERLDILKQPIIIIGVDVNHPGASRGLKPSIAACVGSLDFNLSRYAVRIKVQDNIDEKKQSIEIILELKNMVEELLKAFYRHTKGKKPEKIILYRDGVGEGQFEKVKEHEVRSVREACRSLQKDYEPGITLIVVQKRHHIRFKPEDHRDGIGKFKNIPPGTAVDTEVTHPTNFDFFLCSQFGLQGTSRPSHYTVIEDDNDFTANDLQKLTYHLCYTYARCTKSISIPVPVAYADLAAYRARQHLEAKLGGSSSSSETSDDFEPLPQTMIDSVKVIKELEDAMYYV